MAETRDNGYVNDKLGAPEEEEEEEVFQ